MLRTGLLINPDVGQYMLTETGGKQCVPLAAKGELPGLLLVARGGERQFMPWQPGLYGKIENVRFKGQGITIWALRRDGQTQRILKLIQR